MSKVCDLEQKHLDNPPTCLVCGKKMKPGYDKIQKRISGFVWVCSCISPNMRMLLA